MSLFGITSLSITIPVFILKFVDGKALILPPYSKTFLPC